MEEIEYICPYCNEDVSKEVTKRKDQVVTEYADNRSKIEASEFMEVNPAYLHMAAEIVDKHMTDGEISEQIKCSSCKKTFISLIKVKSGTVTKIEKDF